MAKNEAKIKFTAETSDFNSAIGKANNTIDEMKSALALNATEMKSTGTTADGLEQRHKLLAQQMEATHNKTEALNAKLNKAVEIFGENSDEASKLRKQLNYAKTAEEKLQQEIDKCNAQLKEQQSSSKRAETASESLSNTIEQQETELKGLKKAYTNAVLQYGKNSNAAKELEGKIKTLSTKLKDNKKKMSDAEKAADDLADGFEEVGDNAKDAGDKAEDSSEGWSIVKDVIADMVSGAITWAIESFKEMATAGEDALAHLAARTGAGTQGMAEYGDVMRAIYKNNYGESFEDIGEAMGYVNTILGETDPTRLQETTQNAIMLRDVFDMDYRESMLAVNSMMKQFGGTADEAFNLISQGAQNGLNQNDDLLDVINEYSVHFAAAGYSADDMFNMLNNGVDEGVWSVDKLGDAVKELGIRARDGSAADALKTYRKQLGLSSKDVKRLSSSMAKGGTEGRAAYEEVKTALAGVDDATKRNQIGVALFGTMWEDMGEDAIMALLDTQGELTSTKNAMEEIANTKMDTLSAAWSELGRVFQMELIQPLVDTFSPLVKDFINWIIDHMPIVAPIVAAVAAAFGVLATALAIGGLIKSVTAGMLALNAAIAANPIVALVIAIVAAIAALVAAFVYLWNNCEEFRMFFVNLWEGIKGVIEKVRPYIEAAIQAIGATIEWLKTAFENVKTAVIDAWNWIVTAWTNIQTAVTTAVDAVSTAVSTAWENVKTWTIETFAAIWGAITAAWTWITTTVTTAVEGVKTAVSTAWENIKTAAGDAWDGIKTAITDKVDAAKEAVSTAWETAKTNVTTKWDEISSAASTTWEGIKNFVSNPVETAKTAVTDAFTTVSSTLSEKWESIKSTATTVWESIKSAISTPIENAKTAVSDAIDSIKGFFDFEWSLPSLKMPHFGVSGEFSLNPLSVPKFTIDWYKEGGIMTAPMIFGMANGKLLGGGEAGHEAILPIDKMEDYVASAVDKHMSVVNLEILADKIEDLASRPINLNINGRQFALATAGDGDRVNGLRSTFKNRGLLLE